METQRSLFSKTRSMLASRDGVALLMVLFVVVTLTSLVVYLSDTTQRHIHLTEYDRNGLQAFMTAQAGLQAGAALIKMSAQLNNALDQMSGMAADPASGQADSYSSLWNCESQAYKENVALFMSVPLCGNSLLSPTLVPAVGPPDPENPAQPIRTPCFVVDENRKLGITDLVKNTNSPQEMTTPEVFDRLAWLLQYLLKESDLILPEDMEESTSATLTNDASTQTPIDIGKAKQLAGYIVDWVDSMNNKGAPENNPDQAEDSCPFDGKPYTAKNGAMDSTDELALVCGFRHMPRSTIDELGRNLTAYPVKTNINTATVAVLYAFYAQANNNSPNDAVAVSIYQALHPQGEELPDAVVTNGTDFFSVLSDTGLDEGVSNSLATVMGIRSDIFRMGIAGVVLNTETGTPESDSRVNMVISRSGIGGPDPAAGTSPGGKQPPIYYYREE